MKYCILYNYRFSTPSEEKFFDDFKDIYEVKPLTNFDANLTSFLQILEGVINYVLNV